MYGATFGPMTPDDLRDRIAALTVWRSGGRRAPHKPLLLLFALARFADGTRRFPFSAIEGSIRSLLHDFGPAGSEKNPHPPFWRLQQDGVWTVEPTDGIVLTSSGDPTLTSLRVVDPAARFPGEVATLLSAHPELVAEFAETLLEAHFPPTRHDEILAAVGLDLDALAVPQEVRTPRRRRDPAFRGAVLRAYSYRCAVCGFEARVGSALVGIDAAHVRWHKAGGPDAVENGVALCALHHRLLDCGAFTLTPSSSRETVVEVSEDAHGGAGFEAWLLAFHGRPLAAPTRPSLRVAEPAAAWHRREVFRGPPRPA